MCDEKSNILQPCSSPILNQVFLDLISLCCLAASNVIALWAIMAGNKSLRDIGSWNSQKRAFGEVKHGCPPPQHNTNNSVFVNRRISF